MLRARLMTFRGLLIAIAMSGPLGAQDRSLVELGVTAVRFRVDSLESVGPAGRWQGSRTRGAHTLRVGAGGIAGVDGASGFLELAGRTVVPMSSTLRAELEAEGTALGSSGSMTPAAGAATAVLVARIARAAGARGGSWLGGHGSLSARRPDLLAGVGVHGGTWWRVGETQLSATLERAWNTAQLFVGPGHRGYAGTVPVAYTEANARAHHVGAVVSMEASATVRRDPGAEQPTDWGSSVGASYRVTPTRTLFVSLASALPDFLHGADAARSVTVGLRLFERSSEPTPAREALARAWVQVSGDSTTRTIQVRASGARSVDVMGDFTEWLPVPLAGSGGVFTARVSMTSGNRRLVIRIDGGPWLPPSNTPVVDDDFGGRVGLVLAP